MNKNKLLKKDRQFPHTYVIVFAIVVICGILTWIVPGGSFERETVVVDGIARQVVKSDSFHYVENTPQTWQIFSAIFDGFVDKADIIVFILLIGGAFWILNQTKSIDIGIEYFLKSSKKLEKNRLLKKIGVNNIILVSIMLMFSLFGAIFGMSEETIAFIIIFVPLAVSMGYDSIVGVNLCFVAAGLGFTGAVLNPFTIGIAQGLSNIPLFSGAEYRMFCWLIINIVGFTYILIYASRVKKNPKISPTYSDDEHWRELAKNSDEQITKQTPKSAWYTLAFVAIALGIYSFKFPITNMSVGNSGFEFAFIPVLSVLFVVSSFFLLRKNVHFFILNILLFTILFLIVGVMGYHWYITEIATLFFVMGLLSGIAFGYTPNTITKHFLNGVKDILSAGLIVGLAGGIIIILQNGQIIDTILYAVSSSMQEAGKVASVSIMYLIQTGINLIMPSGSAKAALTMPIMSQFSDLVGISRQASVMAFQFGDGFTNMITPTSGVLMGVLGVARIQYVKWFKWVLPLILILFVLGLLLLIPTVTMDLKGF
ncbi:MAG: AbgT family transporter [Lentimicrobiaceae bacterium]|nr:AbgT family transporter [Lentimicrobiaceae bacterium]